MSSLPLTLDPNSILHRRADDVIEINQEVKELIKNMAETMVTEHGVGLAAPQINKSLRIFVVAHKDGYKAFINPEIYFKSVRSSIDEEGCLSIPGVFGLVKRHSIIKIKYTDENGNLIAIKASGFLARVIQHEYDHIEGILITDRFEK